MQTLARAIQRTVDLLHGTVLLVGATVYALALLCFALLPLLLLLAAALAVWG